MDCLHRKLSCERRDQCLHPRPACLPSGSNVPVRHQGAELKEPAMSMKALILAGGRGKRLEAQSAERNKCMIEFAHKPLIEWSLDNCARISPDEIVVVVGYLAEQIINHYGNSYRGIRIRYAIQREQHGLVHAIEAAAPFLGSSDFMLFLADEIL